MANGGKDGKDLQLTDGERVVRIAYWCRRAVMSCRILLWRSDKGGVLLRGAVSARGWRPASTVHSVVWRAHRA